MTGAPQPEAHEELESCDRQKASFWALHEIHARRVIAIIEWLIPIAKRVASSPIVEEHEDIALWQSCLAREIARAEKYQQDHRTLNALEATYEGKAVINLLAGSLARRLGWHPQESRDWCEYRLSLLVGILP